MLLETILFFLFAKYERDFLVFFRFSTHYWIVVAISEAKTSFFARCKKLFEIFQFFCFFVIDRTLLH